MLDNQWATTLGLRPSEALRAPGSSCGFLMVQITYLWFVETYMANILIWRLGWNWYLTLDIHQPICVQVLEGYADTVQMWLDLIWLNNQSTVIKMWYERMNPDPCPLESHPFQTIGGDRKKPPNTEMSPVNQLKLFWGPYYWKQEADWANKFSGPLIHLRSFFVDQHWVKL